MMRIFCCRSRSRRRVEVDEMTDSLESCLSVENGVRAFHSFLQENHFEEESRTLSFYLECERILRSISKLSPLTVRHSGLPSQTLNDIMKLMESANDINFDLHQTREIESLNMVGAERKVRVINSAQGWAADLLRDVYRTFRAKTLHVV